MHNPNPKIEMTEEIKTFLLENHDHMRYTDIERKLKVSVFKISVWAKELGLKTKKAKGPSEYTPADLEFILLLVSKISGLKVDETRTGGRKIRIAIARQTYCYLAHKYTRNSLKNIGKHIHIVHGAVINALSNTGCFLEIGDTDVVEIVEKAEAELVKIYEPVKRTIYKSHKSKKTRRRKAA